ncbi:MAG: hypothetical protein Fur0020_15660 [Thermodesulfovibrionia bacterium]
MIPVRVPLKNKHNSRIIPKGKKINLFHRPLFTIIARIFNGRSKNAEIPRPFESIPKPDTLWSSAKYGIFIKFMSIKP